MRQERPAFADPATARAFIKYLAMSFHDPRDMSEFLGLCDMAQAVLAHRIVEETLTKAERPAETREHACEGHEAHGDLEFVEKRMRKVLAKLRLSE